MWECSDAGFGGRNLASKRTAANTGYLPEKRSRGAVRANGVQLKQADHNTPDDSAASPFARFAKALDYPLYVVTTQVQAERTGCLIGFATQCSIYPPRFLACLSKKNHTLALARQASVLAVHVVDEKAKEIAELFGGETGDVVDKFAQVRWRTVHGVPVLADCERWFAGEVLQQIDLGDHVGFLLQPLDAQGDAPAAQLTVQQARDIEPGHEP
jgi:flavin reductase (DIM6/NTAB) family NADH-FMN oxidoreductase RutF